jgi:DNA-binding CsgD family transcriptional regulator
VLVGEAGVGKTRLVAEAIRRAADAGVMVLAGGCLPLSESVPFLPIAEALRGLGPAGAKPGGPPVLDRCAPQVRAELARLVPGWGTTTAAPDEAGAIEGWQRARLFAALRDLLEALADERPCALVVEDVHWADATTRDLLDYLSAVDRHSATPLVMTCREEAIDPSRPVGAWLTELSRRAGVAQLPLGRLSRDEVAEHLGGLLGTAVASSFVDEIFARAGGNAFFTEQLVAAGTAGSGAQRPGMTLPRSLARLLVAQADAVGDDGRRLLDVLAIAGRGLDETLLASITDLAGARLAGALRALVHARLIDPAGPDGRYRLRHTLVGEAVTADMLAGERREWHAVVARALAASAVVDRAGEVAEHWAAAGEPTEEMPWRLTAAREAERVYAHREAARHWQRLIDLWPQVPPDARSADLDLATAYLKALAALDACGDSKAAGPLAERALRTMADTADTRTLALVYERVATYRWLDDEFASLEPLEFAVTLLADLPPGREHAIVLHRYADRLFDRGQASEARSYLDRALEACRFEQSPAEEVKILRDLGDIALHDGDIDTGMRRHAQAADLAARHGDQLGEISVDYRRAEALLVLGQLEDAAAAARAGLETARRAGLEQYSYAEFLAYCHFEALAELGRPAEAASVIPATAETTPTSTASLARAHLDVLAGDVAAASARLAAIDAAISPVNLTGGDYLTRRGEIDVWLGLPGQALSRIQQLPGGIAAESLHGYTGPTLRIAAGACADLAEDARARRDTNGEADARKAAQDLVNLHDAMEPDPFAPHPFWSFAPAEGATWVAELTRVAGTPDADAWAAAAAAWATLGRPHRTAYAQWRQAQALLEAGRRKEARERLRDAAAAAQTHVPLLGEIQKLARLAHLDLREKQPTADHTLPAAPTPYGLTPRELDVLWLVADGLTNVQIGHRLSISEKTVSVHITSIMRRLNVKNRAQAAAVAQRAGLLPPDPPA